MFGMTEPKHIEPHIKESSAIRDFVFGFGDGINTSLGIAAGVGAADVSTNIVILAALVGMFTGAKAMAVQNYLAVKTQRQLLISEINREKWEIENKPDNEIKEIEDIYKAKGFSGKDLDMIVQKITSDKKVWLDTMLREELNLNLEIVGNPIKSAFRMFVSFLIGGMLPILPFFFSSGLEALLVAIGISISASFAVGVVKSRMANTNKIIGGLEMAGLGTGVALIGYGIGSELSNLGLISL
ncbi:MAG: VIT1/CCC1 transporter family protein [Nitrosarchaeum sp.]|nr:VIT1/CCC1 transporter family protein [Nitrosarchaeum sp.]